MTDEEVLKLLATLNKRQQLVILYGYRDSMQPFYAVAEVGYHEPTTQFVLRTGDTIDQGVDVDARGQVLWVDDDAA